MKLILARHGNTFGPGDKVFWVGSRSDLPLVEEGVRQAERLREALAGVQLSGVFCGPLQRTKLFAEIASSDATVSQTVMEDPRLVELDYGIWDGLSDAEIKERYGEQSLKGWVQSSIWPTDAEWPSSEKIVCDEVESFVNELRETYPIDATILVVSSNGRLRYFLKLVNGEFEKRVADGSFKVATGRVGLLSIEPNGMSVELWNEKPDALKQLIGR